MNNRETEIQISQNRLMVLKIEEKVIVEESFKFLKRPKEILQ